MPRHEKTFVSTASYKVKQNFIKNILSCEFTAVLYTCTSQIDNNSAAGMLLELAAKVLLDYWALERGISGLLSAAVSITKLIVVYLTCFPCLGQEEK